MPKAIVQNAAIALFLGGVVGITLGSWQMRETLASSIEKLERDTLVKTDKLELLMRNMRLGAEAAAARLDPADLAGSAREAWPAIRSENLGVATILVLDETGTVVATMNESHPTLGLNLSDREYFHLIANGVVTDYYINAPVMARPVNIWVLPLSVPIRDDTGAFAGVVAVGVTQSYFGESIWASESTDEQVFIHLDRADTIIDVLNPGEHSEFASLVEAYLATDHDQIENGEPISVDLPASVAFLNTSASGRFHVLVTKEKRALTEAAHAVGIWTGLGVTLLVASLAMITLQAQTVARTRAADARKIAADAARIEADASKLRLIERRLRLATQAANIGIWDLDLQTGVNTWDATMHSLYGTRPEQFTDDYEGWRRMVHPDHIDIHEAKFRQAGAKGQDFDDTFRIITQSGEERILKARASMIQDEYGVLQRAIGVNFDVTEQVNREEALRKAQARLEHEALHDPLTHLGNRRALEAHIEHLRRSHSADAPVAFLNLDLDRFKAINDLFGHAAGDHLLVSVAEILRKTTQPEDFIARLGGDEFAVIITGGDVGSRGQHVADRIGAACRRPVRYEGKELIFSTSIGLCVGTMAHAHELVGNADIALYEAKKIGRNQSVLFTPELRHLAEEKKRVADALTDAMDRGHITLRFQPQLWSKSRTLAGVEALARWQHPELGELSPIHFIPVAEELGILHEIDDVILVQAVAAAHRLAETGLALPRVSVNTSHRRLMQPNLLDRIDALGPLPFTLAFELLETIDFDGVPDEMMARLTTLRERGIEIEVDDFGTGRASITTLLRVQPDRVKIDRQLVTADILSGKRAHSVLRAITEMADSLGIDVTAEGVETEMHAKRAENLGCDMLQGYLFAKPLTERELLDWAAAQNFGGSVNSTDPKESR